jgi:hypothetical protein
MRKCVLRITEFVDFPHYLLILNNFKTQCFGYWIYFRLQIKGGRHYNVVSLIKR